MYHPCRRLAVTLAAVAIPMFVFPDLQARQTTIAGPALSRVNDLVEAAGTAFYVYLDSDSGMNHGVFSGLFPESAVSRIHVNTACVYDQSSSTGCTTDPNRMDSIRGTVLSIGVDPLPVGLFASINAVEPENYPVTLQGVGYDLRGATRLCFDAVTPVSNPPDFQVAFMAALHSTAFMTVPQQWTEICLDFPTLRIDDVALQNVHYLFTVVTNDEHAASGGRVLLDRIRFEPVPTAHRNVLSFPLANRVFGVMPAVDVLPGRVKIPPDQMLATVATTYESAMALLVLLATGSPRDAANARRLADTFVYALTHDNAGDPIPLAPDGSVGPHNAYFSGDVALYNDQGPGQGRRGQVRLPGFRIESNLCGPSHVCLVLDGATGGNAAFAMIALEAAYVRFHDQGYLDAARMIGRWIVANLTDQTGTGFGGYYLGYPDDGQVKQLLKQKSIENNADIFRAMMSLSDITRGLGQTTEAQTWESSANVAGDYVIQLFDPIAGRFHAGTVPLGVAPSPGIQPDGARRGDDVINTAEFLDAQTSVLLPMASSPRYRNAIDWRRPVTYLLNRFAAFVSVAGQQFDGFNLVPNPTDGPPGLAYEFTAQAVVAMRFVDQLYGESLFESDAQFYEDHIRLAQQFAPFGDGRGLVAAVLQDGDRVPPYEHCLSTPFQCVATRVGLAATTWAIAADLHINPFLDPIAPPVTITVSTVPAGLTVMVDGVSYSSPASFAWGVGTTHTIATVATQTNGPSTYTFQSWSDGGALAHVVTTSAAVGEYLGSFAPQAPPPTGCAIPDPFTSIGGGICENGGWRPRGSGPPAPPPPTGCTIPDPFTAIGGGICENGGWRPIGSGAPAPPPSPPPTGCTIPDPFTSIGGGICENGGWRPIGSGAPAPPPSPPPTGCTIPDPFTSIGGGICENGGWRPRGSDSLTEQ